MQSTHAFLGALRAEVCVFDPEYMRLEEFPLGRILW